MRNQQCLVNLVAISILWLTTSGLINAADFSVANASYTDAYATFTLSSSIPAGDTAEVAITEADAAVRREIRQSLHTSVSAKIEESGSVITVTIQPSTATLAAVTFARPLKGDEVEVRHQLDLQHNVLSSSVAVTEASGTALKWVDATLEVTLRSGAVTADAINLESGKSILAPTKEINNYALGVSRHGYLRTGDPAESAGTVTVYEVLTLRSKSKHPLSVPKGKLSVFNGSSYLFERELPDGLDVSESVDVFGAETPKITARNLAVTHAHIEAVSLADGLLVTRQWKGSPVIVTNRTNDDVTIRLGSQSITDHRARPMPKEELSAFQETMVTSATSIQNLLDIGTVTKLATKTTALGTIQMGDAAVLTQIGKVKVHYQGIKDARESVAKLSAALLRAESVLETLRTTPGTAPELIVKYQAAVDRVRTQKTDAEKREPEILIQLVTDLLP